MRPGIVAAGAAGFLLITCAVILTSPSFIRPVVSRPKPAASAPAPGPASRVEPSKAVKRKTATASASQDETSGQDTGPERVEPRDPLSQIGQALPPKPPMPGDWKGTVLFNPVATAAGSIEAKGYTVTLGGVTPMSPDETCTFEGRDWPCGLRARSAFRAWLRGRAITCVVPPEPERDAIAAACTLGKQDIGAWLVTNGWARADGDAYADLGSAASKDGKGIFGRPGPTDAPTSSITSSTLPSPSSGGVILAPTPADQEEVFPPAPAPPSSSIITLPAAPPAPAQ